jgi:membrane-bound metal-dependent hydrolase YbcI (DUF457 family)
MDTITHLLTGVLVNQCFSHEKRKTLAVSLMASVIPDVGELFIQRELAKKYSAALAVYDNRTSDVLIANDIGTTLVYDLTHSFLLSVFLLLLYLSIRKRWILVIAISQLSHVILDSFTHGKVWPLKLFFPLSNKRYPILADQLGNWWDWQPKFSLYFFELPFHCIIFWIALLLLLKNRKTYYQLNYQLSVFEKKPR